MKLKQSQIRVQRNFINMYERMRIKSKRKQRELFLLATFNLKNRFYKLYTLWRQKKEEQELFDLEALIDRVIQPEKPY